MNFLNRLNPFRKKRNPEVLTAGLLRSSEPSERAHDHFAGGMLDVSNNQLISESERSRLRSWCKKEYLDNPYARNAARNFALGVYGTGPTLQMTTSDEELNSEIEKIWRKWRKKTHFDWKVFTALQSLFYDGEAFFLFYGSPTVPGGLNVELIEARRVRDPYGYGLDENRIEGITFNEYNEPVYYHVAKETLNPNIGTAEEFVTVPADSMMHFFLDDVVNQRRGLPMLQSVLETLASLQRIGRASLNAWELAAKMNLIIQTGMDAFDLLKVVPEQFEGDGEDRFKAFKTIPVPTDGGMTFLANGMSMNQVKTEHPTSQFHENKMTYLTEIGAGVGEPRNIVTGDSSAYNFSSAQLDQQMFQRWGGAVQVKLQDILNRSLEIAVTSVADSNPAAAQLLSMFDSDEIPADWHFPTVLEDLDRVNNASSDVSLLQAGLMTIREYCKRHGLDYEKHMAQLKEEKNALTTADGLKYEAEQNGTNGTEDRLKNGAEQNDPGTSSRSGSYSNRGNTASGAEDVGPSGGGEPQEANGAGGENSA